MKLTENLKNQEKNLSSTGNCDLEKLNNTVTSSIQLTSLKNSNLTENKEILGSALLEKANNIRKKVLECKNLSQVKTILNDPDLKITKQDVEVLVKLDYKQMNSIIQQYELIFHDTVLHIMTLIQPADGYLSITFNNVYKSVSCKLFDDIRANFIDIFFQPLPKIDIGGVTRDYLGELNVQEYFSSNVMMDLNIDLMACTIPTIKKLLAQQGQSPLEEYNISSAIWNITNATSFSTHNTKGIVLVMGYDKYIPIIGEYNGLNKQFCEKYPEHKNYETNNKIDVAFILSSDSFKDDIKFYREGYDSFALPTRLPIVKLDTQIPVINGQAIISFDSIKLKERYISGDGEGIIIYVNDGKTSKEVIFDKEKVDQYLAIDLNGYQSILIYYANDGNSVNDGNNKNDGNRNNCTLKINGIPLHPNATAHGYYIEVPLSKNKKVDVDTKINQEIADFLSGDNSVFESDKADFTKEGKKIIKNIIEKFESLSQDQLYLLHIEGTHPTSVKIAKARAEKVYTYINEELQKNGKYILESNVSYKIGKAKNVTIEMIK